MYRKMLRSKRCSPTLPPGTRIVTAGMTIQDLAREMHAFKKEHKMCDLLQQAYAVQPEPVVTYAESFSKLVRNEVDYLPIEKAGDRIAATGIVPYPPGIPLLAPGKKTGKLKEPVLQYLKSLQDFDNAFPGFRHDTHGVENVNGKYMMYCIKDKKGKKSMSETTKEAINALPPKKILGVFALAMINVAAVLSIRNFPSMAEYGWSSIGWYVIGTILFLIPISLAGAELATGWPVGGGIYAWVKQAFGDKGGFTAIFCEWSNNLVWFPTVLPLSPQRLRMPSPRRSQTTRTICLSS